MRGRGPGTGGNTTANYGPEQGRQHGSIGYRCFPGLARIHRRDRPRWVKKDRLGMGLINPKRYWLEKVSVEAAEVTTFWWNSGVQFGDHASFTSFTIAAPSLEKGTPLSVTSVGYGVAFP